MIVFIHGVIINATREKKLRYKNKNENSAILSPEGVKFIRYPGLGW